MSNEMLQRKVLWFDLLPIPGNDVMAAILALLVETLIYGVVIISVVTLMLFLCVSIYSVEHAVQHEKTELIRMWNGKYQLWHPSFVYLPDSVEQFLGDRLHSAGIPVYFSRRAESFLDVCFLALPTLVVILILVPTLGFLYNNECFWEHAAASFSIDVIGHQWYWSYEYHLSSVDDSLDIVFDSILDVEALENMYLEVDRRVVIPTGVIISVSVTSTDVIHSWSVPQLGIKIDAVPGRIANTVLYSYMDGVFYGQCSELCGVLHGFMPICVESVPSDLFFCWVCLNMDCWQALSIHNIA